jgi:hypothetical protein
MVAAKDSSVGARKVYLPSVAIRSVRPAASMAASNVLKVPAALATSMMVPSGASVTAGASVAGTVSGTVVSAAAVVSGVGIRRALQW